MKKVENPWTNISWTNTRPTATKNISSKSMDRWLSMKNVTNGRALIFPVCQNHILAIRKAGYSA